MPRGNGLTRTGSVLSRDPGFAAMIDDGQDEALSSNRLRAETVGRPAGGRRGVPRGS